MSATQETQFFLLWKGRQSGPFPLTLIREQLSSGEISRMHQINFNGKWIVLDEFLEKHCASAPEASFRVEAQRREEELRRDFDEQIASERARHSELEERLAEVEKRSRTQSPTQLPPPPPGSQQHPIYQMRAISPPPTQNPTRTSGLAIAAFVLSLCNFIPYINFAAWILALVFGHTALSQMKRDPSLDGRGMAVAALVITYFLLAVGVIIVAVMVAKGQRFYNL